MILGDRLDELRKNILRDRSDQIAGSSDQLWTDDTLLRYIRDAEHRFARHTLCIRDATTPSITQLNMSAGVQLYKLDPSILSVISSRFDTDVYDMQRSGHSQMRQFTPAEWLTTTPVAGSASQTGRPVAYYTDETLVFASQNAVTFAVFPTPTILEDGLQMHLRVARLPIGLYSLSNLDELSEIPEDYQLECLEWAAYRAQRNNDTDAGAAVTADSHRAVFEDAVKRAKNDLKRTMFSNVTFRYGTLGTTYVR